MNTPALCQLVLIHTKSMQQRFDSAYAHQKIMLTTMIAQSIRSQIMGAFMIEHAYSNTEFSVFNIVAEVPNLSNPDIKEKWTKVFHLAVYQIATFARLHDMAGATTLRVLDCSAEFDSIAVELGKQGDYAVYTVRQLLSHYCERIGCTLEETDDDFFAQSKESPKSRTKIAPTTEYIDVEFEDLSISMSEDYGTVCVDTLDDALSYSEHDSLYPFPAVPGLRAVCLGWAVLEFDYRCAHEFKRENEK